MKTTIGLSYLALQSLQAPAKARMLTFGTSSRTQSSCNFSAICCIFHCRPRNSMGSKVQAYTWLSHYYR